jgi:uncharacterized cupredoxin-like copper-binding protein
MVVTVLHRPAALLAGMLACAGLLAFAQWGSGGGSPSSVRIVHISERDFHIHAPRRIAPGRVRLEVTNDGPDLHELIVVRDPTGARLPMRTDGLTVNEQALAPEEVGSLEPGVPGSVRGLTLRLRPGRYEIFCNMAGHYMSGMHAVLLVG